MKQYKFILQAKLLLKKNTTDLVLGENLSLGEKMNFD